MMKMIYFSCYPITGHIKKFETNKNVFYYKKNKRKCMGQYVFNTSNLLFVINFIWVLTVLSTGGVFGNITFRSSCIRSILSRSGGESWSSGELGFRGEYCFLLKNVKIKCF